MAAVRDFVPYAYIVMAFIALADAKGGGGSVDKTVRVLRAALAAHLSWCFAVVFVSKSIPDRMPAFDGVHIFEFRSDYDTAIVGIYAALLIHDRLSLSAINSRFWWLTKLSASVAILTVSSSRSGFLGGGLAIILAVNLALRARRRVGHSTAWVLVTAPFLIVMFAIVVPQTTAGQRLSATVPGFEVSNSQSGTAISGAGTERARSRTWKYLLNYSSSDASRFVFGVGFGPDFMAETQAGNLLGGAGFDRSYGDTATRSPHNYWLGTLLRTGLLGGLLVVGIAISHIRRAVRGRARNDLALLASIIGVGLLVPATLGVVFESPFGAIPFFWSYGLLIYADKSAGAAGSTEVPLTNQGHGLV